MSESDGGDQQVCAADLPESFDLPQPVELISGRLVYRQNGNLTKQVLTPR